MTPTVVTNSVSRNHTSSDFDVVPCRVSILDNSHPKIYFSNDMSNLSCSQITRRRLIETITLLWTLTEVPEQPKENKLDCGNDEAKQLTTEREKQLADSFAFISASTDDMLRVMAVCIEEDPDQGGMTIRLASNTGDLSRTIEGFKGIARTLQKAALKGMTVLVQRIGECFANPEFSGVESGN